MINFPMFIEGLLMPLLGLGVEAYKYQNGQELSFRREAEIVSYFCAFYK